ncbi:hypothetical protein NL676_007539 [Syzygium grande]|nr:hypothetical protein NL676_007539 [Syzygium grande]
MERSNGVINDKPGEENQPGSADFRAGSLHPRSPRSSPAEQSGPQPSRFSSSDLSCGNGSSFSCVKMEALEFLWGRDKERSKTQQRAKRKMARRWYQRRGVLFVIGLMGCFLFVNWLMLLSLQDHKVSIQGGVTGNSSSAVSFRIKEGDVKSIWRRVKPWRGVYGRLLAWAAHALAEGHNKPEPKDLWREPFVPASAWKPCSDQRNWKPSGGNNGYIMVTANGGMNQQRVAVCNAVVIARLLNATLVIPRFLYSSVWKDVSQFSDIYQEEHFINYLTPDIRIVKELPEELRSLDLEAVGSLITDTDIRKESKPSFYVKNILPILIQTRVVHFLGFGNRLAFDPIPFQLQRLRCRCNFHALQFVPKIQETGALLLQRVRQRPQPGLLDHYLVGPYAESMLKEKGGHSGKASKYLSLHLRFEIDMVAHSLCEFGGGEEERQELEAFREVHFPALTLLKKTSKLPSPAALREEGLCPLTPEEAVLMLAALGFKRKTYETLLSASELEPFKNFSSQLAALDFIVCTAADAFAMTDSGSQLSSLVSGYRIYYGGGKMPTIRPNKRRLADIFTKNNTIEWRVFEQRVRKAVRQTKHVQRRPVARSIYRFPRCKECMCIT